MLTPVPSDGQRWITITFVRAATILEYRSILLGVVFASPIVATRSIFILGSAVAGA
jgi:hypothetical protein